MTILSLIFAAGGYHSLLWSKFSILGGNRLMIPRKTMGVFGCFGAHNLTDNGHKFGFALNVCLTGGPKL